MDDAGSFAHHCFAAAHALASGLGRRHDRLDCGRRRIVAGAEHHDRGDAALIHIIEIMTQNVSLGVTAVLLLRPARSMDVLLSRTSNE
jgi:hypothetical protein